MSLYSSLCTEKQRHVTNPKIPVHFLLPVMPDFSAACGASYQSYMTPRVSFGQSGKLWNKLHKANKPCPPRPIIVAVVEVKQSVTKGEGGIRGQPQGQGETKTGPLPLNDCSIYATHSKEG